VLVSTHFHYDHVGWSTHEVDGQGVPSSPTRPTWCPSRASRTTDPKTPTECGHPGPTMSAGVRLVFKGSIAPLVGSGQFHTWSKEYRVDDGVRLEPYAGAHPGIVCAVAGEPTGGGLRWRPDTHPCLDRPPQRLLRLRPRRRAGKDQPKRGPGRSRRHQRHDLPRALRRPRRNRRPRYRRGEFSPSGHGSTYRLL